jgi:hypothetical protein
LETGHMNTIDVVDAILPLQLRREVVGSIRWAPAAVAASAAGVNAATAAAAPVKTVATLKALLIESILLEDLASLLPDSAM